MKLTRKQEGLEVIRCNDIMNRPNGIFVFGSNLAGRHGKGAAFSAHVLYGAEMGVGEERTGRCYAIPTKDRQLQTLDVKVIGIHVYLFLRYAQNHPELDFAVTRIGCGYAGYTDADIAPLFRRCNLKNVYLPPGW